MTEGGAHDASPAPPRGRCSPCSAEPDSPLAATRGTTSESPVRGAASLARCRARSGGMRLTSGMPGSRRWVGGRAPQSGAVPPPAAVAAAAVSVQAPDPMPGSSAGCICDSLPSSRRCALTMFLRAGARRRASGLPEGAPTAVPLARKRLDPPALVGRWRGHAGHRRRSNRRLPVPGHCGRARWPGPFQPQRVATGTALRPAPLTVRAAALAVSIDSRVLPTTAPRPSLNNTAPR